MECDGDVNCLRLRTARSEESNNDDVMIGFRRVSFRLMMYHYVGVILTDNNLQLL